MKVACAVVVLLGLAAAGAEAAETYSSTSSRVTPVQKVIELMNGMVAKGQKEKKQEQIQFAAYKQFCDDTSTEKQRAIDEANEQIDMLKADIAKYTATIEKLTKEIAKHDEDISAWTGDLKAAKKVRDLEHDDYKKMHKDYTESIDALQRAIQVLKKEAYDRPQEASLLQVASLKLLPEEAKSALTAFLQDGAEPEVALAPDANAYEFQSHGIIQMLEKLLTKFTDEKTQLEKDEMNAQHAYDLLVQDLNAQIDVATQDRTKKDEERDKTAEAKADAKEQVEETTKARDADMKYLADLKATCAQKATDFESRQQLRTEEIEAIEKAIAIISSEQVAGNADQYLPGAAASMVQEGHAAFAQLRAEATASKAAQRRVAAFLRSRSKRVSSRVLAALADRVADDPFQKVKKMIKDLIVRLMEEASEEADHKAWCDEQLHTNEQVRKDKTAQVETLHAEIDELQASIAKLTQEIAQLVEDVAALDEAMKNATALRVKEKAANEETIKDAKEAQVAVAQAITVLKEFYQKAGEATAFLQKREDPTIFESPYKGMQAEKGGVVGMLEVIESDFARLESDTTSAEAAAQEEYDQFMTDSKADKAAKTTDIEEKTATRQDQEQALVVANKDLAGTQEELAAALDYFDKLKPSCIQVNTSYADRVERRKEEIESLQQALEILNGETVPDESEVPIVPPEPTPAPP